MPHMSFVYLPKHSPSHIISIWLYYFYNQLCNIAPLNSTSFFLLVYCVSHSLCFIYQTTFPMVIWLFINKMWVLFYANFYDTS